MEWQKVLGRSVPGFDLHDALCKSGEFLEKYGGHEMAVGLSLKKENFEKFKNRIEQVGKAAHTDELISLFKVNIDDSVK